MGKKLCSIEDIIPVKVYSTSPRKVVGPIRNVYLTDAEIFTILNSIPSPKHMYAIDEKTGRRVLLTKSNYNKSADDLFSVIAEMKAQPTEVKVPLEQPVTVEKEIIVEKQDVKEPVESVDITNDTPDVETETSEESADEVPVQSYKSYRENKKKHRR